MRIVLKQERKLYVIDGPIPVALANTAPRVEHNAYKKHQDDVLDVSCLMLAIMNSELQKQHELMDAYEMIEHLKKLFEGHARQERYDTSKAFYHCKMGERDPAGPHVLKMIGYIEYLDRLGFSITPEAQTDLLLQSLNISYSQFVMNYIMNEIEKPLTELLSMLRTVENNMEKAGPAPIMMVQKGNAKRKGKCKKKIGSKSGAKPNFKTKQALKPTGWLKKVIVTSVENVDIGRGIVILIWKN